MLWIVSGPSSAGKSHILASTRFAEITGLASDAPVMHPSAKRLSQLTSDDVILHYNLLRPSEFYLDNQWKVRSSLPHRVRSVAKKIRDTLMDRSASYIAPPEPVMITDFNTDPSWAILKQSDIPMKAMVLVASKKTLLNRIVTREKSELEGPRHNTQYNTSYWLEMYAAVDLVELYQKWCEALEDSGVPYILVDANDEQYRVIEHKDMLTSMHLESTHPKKVFEDIIKNQQFGYHRVNLPYGLHVDSRRDRSHTMRFIYPPSMQGQSLLDIGCAFGYFCFEAERRGANRVVGIELNERRFEKAERLRELMDSQVTFIKEDIITYQPDELFDYVLLLNVLHHLTAPFHVLYAAARLVQKQLIIEFPTLTDRNFAKVTSWRPTRKWNEKLLIGVSSLKDADQTFVFSPRALEQILVDHSQLFERVEFIDSPMPERMIAICHKKSI